MMKAKIENPFYPKETNHFHSYGYVCADPYDPDRLAKYGPDAPDDNSFAENSPWLALIIVFTIIFTGVAYSGGKTVPTKAETHAYVQSVETEYSESTSTVQEFNAPNSEQLSESETPVSEIIGVGLMVFLYALLGTVITIAIF